MSERQKQLQTYPFPVGQYRFARCLILRVRSDGASWVFRYTSPTTGKRREMGLGICDHASHEVFECSLHAALKLAAEKRAILLGGGDPIDARNKEQYDSKVTALRTRALTMRRVLRRYHEACVEPYVSFKYSQQWIYRVEHDCPEWLLEKPTVDVTSADILRAATECCARRSDLLRQRLDQAMEWLISSGSIDKNPAGVRRNTRGRWKQRFAAWTPQTQPACAT